MQFLFVNRSIRFLLWAACALALMVTVASPLHAQNDKKKKQAQQSVDTKNGPALLNDQQQIDYTISEMLGAWQVGDTERMHKYYADDVSVVNGGWAPPIIGWANYVALYKQQRARMRQVRMDRTNTYIKINGNTAWACYQWDFSGTFDDNPSAARGQTTLIFEKRNDQWVIVHDHTSVTEKAQPASSTPATTPSDSSKPPTQ